MRVQLGQIHANQIAPPSSGFRRGSACGRRSSVRSALRRIRLHAQLPATPKVLPQGTRCRRPPARSRLGLAPASVRDAAAGRPLSVSEPLACSAGVPLCWSDREDQSASVCSCRPSGRYDCCGESGGQSGPQRSRRWDDIDSAQWRCAGGCDRRAARHRRLAWRPVPAHLAQPAMDRALLPAAVGALVTFRRR